MSVLSVREGDTETMKKIVTAWSAIAVFKWIFSVFFVIGVSMFVNDAFIGDVTAPARGTDLVVLSACMMMLVTSFGQSVGNAVDRLATVSLAGAFIFMGFPTAYPPPVCSPDGAVLVQDPALLSGSRVGRQSI